MEPSTKHQILDAAERLFAEFGVDATSLRAVTSTAGVHLAAVNYHFGSKDGLVRAVFARRLEPLNAERLAALEGLLGHTDEPGLDDLLRALFEPALRM
ncbi:MAG: TetR/AcrR family transcriptional regulator, partial [Planctomycetota bacterium]